MKTDTALPATEESPDPQVWYREGLAFSCQGCGACCSGEPGYVWIREEEREILCKRLKISVGTFMERYGRITRNRICLRERKNGDCVLLDLETRACIVYEDRPVQCRTWPWWPENLQTKAAWDQCARVCPGINAGKITPASLILLEVEKDRLASG